MRYAQLRLLVALGVATVALTSPGCFNAALDVELKPDLGMNVGVEMKIPSEFMTEDMKPADMGEMDEVSVEEVDGMHVIRAVKMLGPEETMAPEEMEAGMELMRQKVAHRLSTRYVFIMELPANAQLPGMPGSVAEPVDEDDTDDGADGDDDGDDMEFDPQALAGLMSGFFSGFEFGMNIRMPGKLVSTTGEMIDNRTAFFGIGLDQMMSGEATRLTAVSSLPNYAHLGRLADQMILAGGDADIVSQLPAYLEAGLLPDPPLETTKKYKLSAEDYLLLANIISTLDQQLPADMTEAVIDRLGLNDDDVKPAQIQSAAASMAGKDLQLLAVDGVVGALE